MVSSSTYRSLDMIRRDNQGRAHVKVIHRCSFAMDHVGEPTFFGVTLSADFNGDHLYASTTILLSRVEIWNLFSVERQLISYQ